MILDVTKNTNVRGNIMLGRSGIALCSYLPYLYEGEVSDSHGDKYYDDSSGILCLIVW